MKGERPVPGGKEDCGNVTELLSGRTSKTWCQWLCGSRDRKGSTFKIYSFLSLGSSENAVTVERNKEVRRGNWGWGKDDYFSFGHVVCSLGLFCLVSIAVSSSLKI